MPEGCFHPLPAPRGARHRNGAGLRFAGSPLWGLGTGRTLRAALPGAERAALEGEIERDLEPYRGRMPEVVLAQVREESLARRLLERWSLPRLTLYETM